MPTYEEIDTPESYRKYHDGEGLPAKLKIWRVHAEPANKDIGLVSDGYRFADSPDCEHIAGGLNSKNIGACALGRQGNWFLWGFCGTPDLMTEEARKVFLNTLAYMKRFDGQGAIVTKVSSGRDWALDYTRFHKGEERRKYVQDKYGPLLLAEFEKDPDGFSAKVAADLGYLYRYEVENWVESRGGEKRKVVKRPVELDADAKAIGIANHDPRILEACVKDVEDGKEKERALRVLRRYTMVDHGDDAKAWRAWLREHRGRLFFSDAGGFKFFVAPAAAEAKAAER